jgi:hypothetical protein
VKKQHTTNFSFSDKKRPKRDLRTFNNNFTLNSETVSIRDKHSRHSNSLRETESKRDQMISRANTVINVISPHEDMDDPKSVQQSCENAKLSSLSKSSIPPSSHANTH